jgi:hypothetical protein
MKKMYVLLFLFFCAFAASAQDTGTESGIKNDIGKLEMYEDFKPELPRLNWDDQVKNDPFRLLKQERFNKFDIHSVDDAFYYSFYGNLTIAPGLYTAQTAGAGIAAQINRSFLVNFGAYGMKYDFNWGHQPYYDAVLHVDASFKVLPWLIAGDYGQFSALSRYNAKQGSMLPSPMIPYSGYGVHATTMFTDIFGIHGSVEKVYDPFNNQWKPVYGISPVINLNKLFK